MKNVSPTPSPTAPPRMPRGQGRAFRRRAPSPALSQAVAEALVGRVADLRGLSLTVILDADPQAYRIGYGEVIALEVLCNAAAAASFRLRLRLRLQPGVRIGLVVSDDQTLVYAPVSASIEAG